MFEITNFFSLIGWVYLFYAIVDYLGSKFFNLHFFRSRSVIKEILLINIIFIIVIIILAVLSNSFGPSADSSAPLFVLIIYILAVVLQSYLSDLFYYILILFLSLKIYQFILKKSQKNKIVKIVGLLVAIIFIISSLGTKDFRVVLCQLNYENIVETIMFPGSSTKDCVIKIALENNEVELCNKFGDPNECLYQLGLKTNDISFCEKIKKKSGEYNPYDDDFSDMYIEDCYNGIALAKKDLSLCEKSGKHLKSCVLEIANDQSYIKKAIISDDFHICHQEPNQEKRDECYYYFIKSHNYDTDFYKRFCDYIKENSLREECFQ